jgi:hypothetical protein
VRHLEYGSVLPLIWQDFRGWAEAISTSGAGGSLAAAAPPVAVTASCYNGHATNTAVENTFVQFYPTLFEVEKKMGTVKATLPSDEESQPARRPPAMVP